MKTSSQFWSKVKITDLFSCWLWTGALNSDRYGHLVWHGNHILAHRLAWTFVNGPIPPDRIILHECDVTNCVNPTHLRCGTQRDNIKDMISKGRCSCGQNHPCAKLTSQEVRAIRQSDLSFAALSELYPISRSQVYRLRSGKSWAHLD